MSDTHDRRITRAAEVLAEAMGRSNCGPRFDAAREGWERIVRAVLDAVSPQEASDSERRDQLAKMPIDGITEALASGMSEAEKDTRELNTVLSVVRDLPYKEKQRAIKAVERLEAALSAAEAERDKAQARVLALESQGAVTVVANPLRERAERAEATLAEALDLLERARPACEVQHWSGAGEHPVLGPLSREMQAFLAAHGRR